MEDRILFNIYKGRGDSDEEAQAKVDAAYSANSPEDIKNATNFVNPENLPKMTATPSMDLTLPSANAIPVPNGVDISTDTLKMGGNLPTSPQNQDWEGSYGVMPEGTSTGADTIPPEAPKSTPEAPETEKGTPIPPELLKGTTSADNDARNVELAIERRKHGLGAIPVALAGAAEAVGNAAVPFGGQGAKGAVEGVKKTLEQDEKDRKLAFEEKLKNDPSSQISQHYQKVLGLMLGKKADDMQIKGLSASQIATTLPEVEKYMMKDLQMQTIKANKEVMLGLREDQQQDKLEQNYRQALLKTISMRSGGLGMQDAKLNAAIHARQLIDGAPKDKNGNLEINQMVSPELALTLANIVSGSTSTSLEVFKNMNPDTLYKSVQSSIGHITGKPVNVLTPEWQQSIKHMLDRQGLTSEALRDKYIEGIKSMRPTTLDPKRAETLEKAELGSSYAETFGLNKQGKNPSAPTQPGTDPLAEKRKALRAKLGL